MHVKTLAAALMALLLGLAALTPVEASQGQGIHQKRDASFYSLIVAHPARRHATAHHATHAAYSHGAYGAPTSYYANDATGAIAWAAARWGVSYSWLLGVAECESGLNPNAYNPSGASGLFQFMPGTYWTYAARIGETRSYWNAYGAADVAAYMFSIGQSYQWTCR